MHQEVEFDTNLPYAPWVDSLNFLSGSEASETIEGDTEIGIVVVLMFHFLNCMKQW